jgi:glycosyltransferase involved in cell wall biosynthesis/peptidoglycan/xylan/chitin deacetylase (PgdA/CDA1 family)
MSAWPSVSIVIPTYQRRDVVCDAVRALGRADYAGSLEIVVVVDGSTDGTAEALHGVDCRFPLKIVETPNRGAGAARNRGAAEASGDVILFVDDDMICDPNIVEEHARSYREGADAVIGDVHLDPGSPPGFLTDSTERWLEASRAPATLTPFDVFTGQLSIRRSVFEALGGFDESYTAASAFSSEDSDLGVRLFAAYDVRRNPAAISRQRFVVGVREFVDRGRAAAAGHLRFARKHPRFSRELLELNRARKPMVRFVYRPLSRIPFIPSILSLAAVLTAELALKTRFRSSRMVARLVTAARCVGYWSAVRAGGGLPESDKLLVLGYHAIEDQSDDPVLAPYGVPPAELARHIDSLADRGFSFVGPDALAAFIRDGAPFPSRAVLLTFDDGYCDLLAIAREVLRPRGIQAIAFAVTATGSDTNEWDQRVGARRIKLLRKEELRELAAMGIEIGSHSRTHRQLPLLGDTERRSETAGSADDLVAGGIARPRFFAFPYGDRDAPSMQSVEDAGYLAAVGAEPGRVNARSNRFDLRRVIIRADDRGWRFRLKTAAPAAFQRISDMGERAGWALSRLRRRLVGAR